MYFLDIPLPNPDAMCRDKIIKKQIEGISPNLWGVISPNQVTVHLSKQS